MRSDSAECVARKWRKKIPPGSFWQPIPCLSLPLLFSSTQNKALFVRKVSANGAHFGRVIRPALPFFVAAMPRSAMDIITQQAALTGLGYGSEWKRYLRYKYD
jgi:hypothetical protein